MVGRSFPIGFRPIFKGELLVSERVDKLSIVLDLLKVVEKNIKTDSTNGGLL